MENYGKLLEKWEHHRKTQMKITFFVLETALYMAIMAIFNSYVQLPEGIPVEKSWNSMFCFLRFMYLCLREIQNYVMKMVAKLV